ncbi:hydrolase 1, exosortase A system-associated [Massilia sp. RP-1-19]|uniref:Hydrolase 1, exosortase A system-associated n=1 Tax=Massilia polaris TaxID=2728846 RepID=A0A848HES6_9BURK|nr:hydrolase 1, exosortase A system-associated [Massilia polaris]NML60326.1 hydrolase 1, exosortase A system-associated [Massilia polaris]
MMPFTENAISFDCQGEALVGIVCQPETSSQRGVLVVVGGPQYRAGSQRQFVLLARALGEQGVASMRFDYRGMGDSEGAMRSFEQVGDDLRAAVDAFMQAVPSLRDVALWGLCDGASAALFYAASDARVTGVTLLNPWVRTPEGLARATLKHYYVQRLFEASLWRKLLSGKFRVAAALTSAAGLLQAAGTGQAGGAASAPAARLPERMLAGLSAFKGEVLLILSGADLTAQEFMDVAAASPAWQAQLKSARTTRRDLAAADHTFSRAAWRRQVALWTTDWLKSW